MAVSVKDVDKAKSSTRHIVMLCRVLLCIGDEQATVDVLDAERRVSCWNRWIIEAAVGGHRHIHSIAARSGGAEHVDSPGIEVGRKQENAVGVGAKDETLVNRAAR